ncbi:hypothetical protein DUNSADRAFT_8699 [Dunaliella salina]|uniref:Guanylate cyclase domain-containing protein n=1 Tax=Dunaliella salina TaxID=3046 RepID=A0ABQ7GIY7_DUNSA|nr:hypothetical protein DUNSADRAFT_8699 [Dunaliella salina]|eukprot:KAF5834574.1 hypothetical protein DUNSADRAFT_8699 [Dunaliella salina]
MFSCCLPSPREQFNEEPIIQEPHFDNRHSTIDNVVRPKNGASQVDFAAYLDHEAPAAGSGTTQPANADVHGALCYDDLSVLHYFQGEQCDILFTSIRFQGLSVAALLEGVLSSMDQDSGGAELRDKSKVFLEKLLNRAERAQAAEAAVLQGVPFVTVVEKQMPVLETAPPSIGSESRCSSPPHSAAMLAKLALQPDFSRLPTSVSRSMQVSSGKGPGTFKDLAGISTEQQQQQQQQQQQSVEVEPSATEGPLPVSKDGSPFQTKALSEPFMLRPITASQRPALTTLPEDSSSHQNCIQGSDQHSLDRPGPAMGVGTLDCSGSELGRSTPSISHPLLAHGHSSDPPAACISGPSAQPSMLPHMKAAQARAHSLGSGKSVPMLEAHSRESSTAQCSRSKTLPSVLSSSACGVYEPLSSNLSGEFDRTLAMLQTLQLAHSPSPSNEALPALSTSASKSSTAAGARRKPARKVASSRREIQCPSSATDLHDLGMHIGDFGERERQMPAAPKSSPAVAHFAKTPAAAAPANQGSWPTMRDGAMEEKQGACHEGQPGVLNSGKRESDEKSGVFSTCRSNTVYVGQGSQAEGSQASLEERVFEVSIRSIPPALGRRKKAVGMVSIVDITEQYEAQAALLSLAEGQLSLLSSFLPRHAIEFLARRDSNADTIPQNVGKLARSHKMATVLFMDICGFTSLSMSNEPHEVMEMLNALFSRVDKLTDKYKVHKVETAGDCYIVSSGVLSDQTFNGFPCTLDHHGHPEVSASRVMEFAKAVLQETAKVNMPHSSNPVQMRVGIHSGDVVSGLIGTKLPKFSIFGDSMCTAARMESTGKPGRIHVSETTQGLLPEYAWESVGKINVKGKGMMQTYLWDAGKGWSQQTIQRREQQLIEEAMKGSGTYHLGYDQTGPLSLAINVIRGLTGMRSRSSNLELEHARQV